MPLYGLIGYPLSHSFSKGYFSQKFSKENKTDFRYENFPIENIEGIHQILNLNPDLEGFNVTIPYKEKILPFLDRISQEASQIGAVNTVKVFRNNDKLILSGFNTDIYGFKESIKPYLQECHSSALILGTGGASKAVKTAFEQMHIPYLFVSRKSSEKSLSYEELTTEIIHKHHIIVNTTPLGTYPDVSSLPPIPYSSLTCNHLLYDLVYNPEVTAFLKMGQKYACQTVNGLKMLHLQAEKAWDIWNSNL
jgi:shikimate dehydrogenase